VPTEARLDPGAPEASPASEIGARLRAERQRKEQTVPELARPVGVSPSQI
jgi:hypothetical protein